MAAKQLPESGKKKKADAPWDLRKILSTIFISFISIAMLIMFVFGSSVGSCQASKRVLAEVGSQQIMIGSSEHYDIMQRIQKQNKQLSQQQAAMQALDQLIMNKLLLIAADRNGIVVKDSFLKVLLNNYLAQIKKPAKWFNRELKFQQRQQLLSFLRDQFKQSALRFDILSAVRQTQTKLRIEEMINGLQARVAAVIVNPATVAKQLQATPAQLQAFFSTNTGSYGTRLNASHILFSDIEKARQVYTKLKQADREAFAAAAKRYSKDTTTAKAGGSLDWFFPADMVEPFAKAALGLKPGSISKPVKTRFGYHLIRIEQRQDFPSFAAMDAAARKALGEAYRRKLQSKLTAQMETEYRKKLEQISKTASGGTPLAAAARAAGLQTVTSGWFNFYETPQGDPRWSALQDPGIQTALFSLKKGATSPVLSSGDSLLVVQLLDKKTVQPGYLALFKTNTAAKLNKKQKTELAKQYNKASSALVNEIKYLLYMDWMQSLEKKIHVRKYSGRIQ